MSKYRMTSTGRSERQLKVGEEVRQALSGMFLREDFYDEDLNTISVTVSEVRISPDLQNATIFIMPLGGKDPIQTLEQINGNAARIRHQLSKLVYLKRVPELCFRLDTTFDNAHRIDTLIKEVQNEREVVTEE